MKADARSLTLSWMSASKTAVVLLSGGLDSTTCLAVAKAEGYEVHALTFRYGQRHAHEIDLARRIAAHWGVGRHVVADVDLRVFGGSALTSDDVQVPKHENVAAMGAEQSGGDGRAIPVTYVPARNTIFLSYALGLAEVTGAAEIFVGVNALDYSGYPDCRPEYLDAFQAMADLATRAGVEGRGVRLRAPLLRLTKAEIVALGTSLGVDYGATTSCYDPATDPATGAPLACGHCDACLLRQRGFEQAGIPDPTRYVGEGDPSFAVRRSPFAG